MVISESSRHHLYEAARTGRWDDQAAEALMTLLPPVGWADVAQKRDLDVLAAQLRTEMGALRSDVRGELKAQTTRLLFWLVPIVVAGMGFAARAG